MKFSGAIRTFGMSKWGSWQDICSSHNNQKHIAKPDNFLNSMLNATGQTISTEKEMKVWNHYPWNKSNTVPCVFLDPKILVQQKIYITFMVVVTNM